MMRKLLAVALSLAVCSVAQAAAKDPAIAPDANTQKVYPGAEYIVPGRLEGTTGFISESEAPKKSNPPGSAATVKMAPPIKTPCIGTPN